MPDVTVYWASTAWLCLLYLTSAFLYVTRGTWTRQALADLAHLGVRKPLGARPAVIGLALLAASFTTRNAARAIPSPYPLAAAF